MMNLILQAGAGPIGGSVGGPGGANGGAGGDPFFPIVMIVVFFIFIYFLSIRPQNQRVKLHKQMLEAIVRGDVIVTNGGLIGKVKKVSEDELTVDLGEVEVKVLRSMIADVRNKTIPANDTGKNSSSQSESTKKDKKK